jgi:AcrR family transcriptional regulator
VLEAAAARANRDGLSALTLAAVAADLGVRLPSLYNHVSGLEGLHRGLALRALAQLRDVLQGAVAGRARSDALHAAAAAYRQWALSNRGLYAATLRAPGADDAEHLAAASQVVEVLVAMLRGYALEGDAAIHTIRALRAAMHGFVSLEIAGGFGLPLATDQSYTLLIDLLERGIDIATKA